MRALTSQVKVVGPFRYVDVGDMTFRTNLMRRGFWIAEQQTEGTGQRKFASDAAFRRYAQRIYREQDTND